MINSMDDSISAIICAENAELKANVKIVQIDYNVWYASDVIMKCYVCGAECRGVRKVFKPAGGVEVLSHFFYYFGCPEHKDSAGVTMSYGDDNYVQFLREIELFGFSFIDNSTIAFKYSAMLSMVNRLIRRLPVEEQEGWREALNKIDPTPMLDVGVRKLEIDA